MLGASGLVGGYCLDYLLEHPSYTQVVLLNRRKLKREHDKLVQHEIDFDQLNKSEHLLVGDDLFLCLGTTMAKAGSKDTFYKVDYTYSMQAARISVENGVNQILLVSSVGADKDAFFFYSKVKGELEEDIKKLPFWAIHIFQPSILLGERNENRWGESIAARLGRGFDYLTGGLLTKYRPVEAEVVAKAMVSAAQRLESGITIYPSHHLQRLAEDETFNKRLKEK